MLDFIGMVITAALMVLVVNALTTFMDASRASKIMLAALIGIWIGLAAAVAGAGWLTISRPVPLEDKVRELERRLEALERRMGDSNRR